MRAGGKHVISLRAGIAPPFHVERDWPGASEFNSWADRKHPLE